MPGYWFCLLCRRQRLNREGFTRTSAAFGWKAASTAFHLPAYGGRVNGVPEKLLWHDSWTQIWNRWRVRLRSKLNPSFQTHIPVKYPLDHCRQKALFSSLFRSHQPKFPAVHPLVLFRGVLQLSFALALFRPKSWLQPALWRSPTALLGRLLARFMLWKASYLFTYELHDSWNSANNMAQVSL